MKKKLMSLILCGVLAMSSFMLTACGSDAGDKAAAPAEEVAEAAKADAAEEETVEEETADDDAVTDETWEQLQDLYVKLIEARDATVEYYNDESVAQDDKIEEGLNTADELIEQIGNVERADVKESEAEEYVEAMVAVNDIFAAVLDVAQPAGGDEEAEDDGVDYSQMFTECYAGITDDENTYAYLAFGDIGALMFFNAETQESGSFVGAYEVDEENGAITITDESLGVTMTFTVEEGDGGYYLDMGDIGAAFVEEVDVDDFMAAMDAINAGAEPQF